MFIPLRTDRAPRRTPVATQLLIAANLIVFMIAHLGDQSGWFTMEEFVAAGSFAPQDVRPWQLITYQFLHAPYSIWHIGPNMIFLWVFGSAVEGRLRSTGFLTLYFIGGVVAGVGHAVLSPSPVIGASGSVAAVTGAFLALFPRSTIQVLVFFFIIGVYHIPSLWFIGLYFAIDLFNAVFNRGGGVAYGAHLAGYIYGFSVAFLLLALKLLPRTEFDAFYLLKQWRRRRQFRSVSTRNAGGMWRSEVANAQVAPSRRRRPLPEDARSARDAADDPPHDELAEHRQALQKLVRDRRLDEAARRYLALAAQDIHVCLQPDAQLDVANQLYAEGEHAAAARAYADLIEQHREYARLGEVFLLLGVLNARYLDKPSAAKSLLQQAKRRRLSPDQESLADDLLGELPA